MFILSSNSIPIINLDESNTIILRGEIDKESVSRTIYEINKIKKKTEIYLILYTYGG